MTMEFGMAKRLINAGKEKEKNERYYRQWLVQLPFMSKDDFISFEDYKKRLNGEDIDMRPTDELIAELDEVEKQFERGRKENGT